MQRWRPSARLLFSCFHSRTPDIHPPTTLLCETVSGGRALPLAPDDTRPAVFRGSVKIPATRICDRNRQYVRRRLPAHTRTESAPGNLARLPIPNPEKLRRPLLPARPQSAPLSRALRFFPRRVPAAGTRRCPTVLRF